MSERSVAEIIGWTYDDDTDTLAGGSGFEWKDERGIRRDAPTVDDMLDWLIGQGRPVQISGCHPGAYKQVRIGKGGQNPGDWIPFSRATHALTLLAALEAAVRAVGETA